VASFVQLLQAFSGCFTSPSMVSFVTLMAGWALDFAGPAWRCGLERDRRQRRPRGLPPSERGWM
jgi:hypothetical protein